MKKITISAILFLSLILFKCASYRAIYDIGLSEVERPAQAQSRYGTQKIIKIDDQGVLKYQFEDEMVKILWFVTSRSISFELFNKTDHSIKIIWDEAAFVNIDGETRRVMHSGVKYVDRNNPQPPSIIIRKGTLSDVIVPSDHVYYISGKYGGWQELPLFPDAAITEEELKTKSGIYLGKSIQILLPLQMEDIINEYIFTFKINDILISGKSISTSLGEIHTDNSTINSDYEAVTSHSDSPKVLINQENLIYLEIKNIVKKYMLINIDNDTPMHVGDNFSIVRFDDSMNKKILGFAKVVQVKENKVALEMNLLNHNNMPKIGDKIEYSNK